MWMWANSLPGMTQPIAVGRLVPSFWRGLWVERGLFSLFHGCWLDISFKSWAGLTLCQECKSVPGDAFAHGEGIFNISLPCGSCPWGKVVFLIRGAAFIVVSLFSQGLQQKSLWSSQKWKHISGTGGVWSPIDRCFWTPPFLTAGHAAEGWWGSISPRRPEASHPPSTIFSQSWHLVITLDVFVCLTSAEEDGSSLTSDMTSKTH